MSRPIVRLTDAQRALAEAHLPLTKYLFRRLARLVPPGMTPDEAFSACCWGLLRAAAEYDPAQGYGFSALLNPWLFGSVSKEIRSHERRWRKIERGERRSPPASPSRRAQWEELLAHCDGLLDARERVIFRHRLLGDETSAFVGAELGLTGARVRQLEVKMVAKLRAELPAVYREGNGNV